MSMALRKAGIKDNEREKIARFCEANFNTKEGVSLTSQSPSEEVNINKIMARVQKGQPVLTSSGTPFYGDVSELGGLQEAFIKVQESEELFMQFPAELRERFDNDPVEFVEFLENPDNRAEAIKLGLIKPVEAVPEPSPASPAPANAGPTQ